MESNRQTDYKIFDHLIEKGACFALYRLPGEKALQFVLQEDQAPLRLERCRELNNCHGFVMAPFRECTETPVILLRPDIVLQGETPVFDYLSTLPLPEEIPAFPSVEPTGFKNSYQHYAESFKRFYKCVNKKEVRKLVLSRSVAEPCPEGFSAGETFRQACCLYPDNFVYLCHTPLTGAWLGCSPELLLSGKNTHWQTVALAGTQMAVTERRWDQKNLEEQQVVVDYMQKQLNRAGYAYRSYGPYTVQTGNLLHLKTDFSFSIQDTTSLGDLLDTLHPTPAVCGFPKEDARTFIFQNEPEGRQYYSGFLGMLDPEGQTDLYVNLRCMQIGEGVLRLYAGGGILSSSSLESEWEETENKMEMMRSIIHATTHAAIK